MRTITRRSILAAIAAIAVFARALGAQSRVSFPTSELIIESGAKRHRFAIEVAVNDEQRALGLMHRTQLAADSGMLFDFQSDQVTAMWMRNTRIPLDMLFIAHDGRIVNIAQRTVPFSEASVFSDGPVRAVLELNGGTVSRLGIRPGDRVVHPIFKSAP
jgi:uncharacterized membrane protein (UPF0127 family)